MAKEPARVKKRERKNITSGVGSGQPGPCFAFIA